MNPIRVLHCPDIVGGNPANLARAERELGLKSWAITFQQSIYSYPIDEVLQQPTDSSWIYGFNMFKLLWNALRHYDVIHYNCGQTIFPYAFVKKDFGKPTLNWLIKIFYPIFRMMDLHILHRANKCIAVTFQGDDARQGDYCLENFEISPAHFVGKDYYSSESDANKRKMITKYNRYANQIYYLNPDLGHVLPKRAKFMPYAHIDMREWEVVPVSEKPRPQIIHAPSHRGVKGTNIILQIVQQLKNQGLDFDFHLIEGLTNKDARKSYERADILIDQLYAGWYGGLAVELMALGKPVMCYIRDRDLKFIPQKMREELPIIKTTHASLNEDLYRWLTTKKHNLISLGLQSREFVEKWHDPLKIAAQLRDDYQRCLKNRTGHFGGI